MKKLQPKVQPDPRSVALYRVKSEKAGMEQALRNYQPYEGSPYSNIGELAEALDSSYDILVLHDQQDECLVVVLAENKAPEISKLECRIHHPK